MGEKHWYMQLDVSDWMADSAVCLLKPATRGIWMDAICRMFMLDRRGELTGTIEDLTELCRCRSVNEMRAALDDLKLRNAADVTERNGIVTLGNRRMRREYTGRKSARDRQQRHRHPEPKDSVTPVSRSPSRDCSYDYDCDVGGGGAGAGESSDLARFFDATGLGPFCGPKQTAEVRGLISVAGCDAAVQVVNEQIASGYSGVAAVTYATKVLAGEKAKQALNRRKPLDKAVKYE